MGYAGLWGANGFADGAVLLPDWDDAAFGVCAEAADEAYRADAGYSGPVAVLGGGVE